MIELFLIGVFLFVVLAGCCWEVVFFRLVASSTDVFEEDLAGVGVIAFSVSSELNISGFAPMKSTLKSDWSIKLKALGTVPAIVSTWLCLLTSLVPLFLGPPVAMLGPPPVF